MLASLPGQCLEPAVTPSPKCAYAVIHIQFPSAIGRQKHMSRISGIDIDQSKKVHVKGMSLDTTEGWFFCRFEIPFPPV